MDDVEFMVSGSISSITVVRRKRPRGGNTSWTSNGTASTPSGSRVTSAALTVAYADVEIFARRRKNHPNRSSSAYGFTVEDDRPAADVLTVLPPWIDEAPRIVPSSSRAERRGHEDVALPEPRRRRLPRRRLFGGDPPSDGRATPCRCSDRGASPPWRIARPTRRPAVVA